MSSRQDREALVLELARRAAESAVALGQLRFTIDEAADGSGPLLRCHRLGRGVPRLHSGPG